ncbi:MAG: hypothetical protein ACRD1V_17915 [Vicinamibacterales bacterium]
MNRAEFLLNLDAWLKTVRDEAIGAFDTKCNAPDILNIAVAIANSRANAVAAERAARTVLPVPGLRLSDKH